MVVRNWTPKVLMMQYRFLNMIVHTFDRSPIFDMVVEFGAENNNNDEKVGATLPYTSYGNSMRFGD